MRGAPVSARRRVIMVSPSITDPGGISSVVRSLLASDLSEGWAIRQVGTVRGSGLARHLRGAAGVFRAVWHVATEPGSVVHVHMSYGGSFWRKAIVLATARALGRASVLHLHGSRFHTWAADGTKARSRAVRRVFGWPQVVVVLSHSWSERVREFSGRDDCVVVPNPVTIPLQPSSGIGGHRVVFFGRLGERKGVYELLGAIAELQRGGVEAAWTLAGDGDVERVREIASGLPHPSQVSVPGWMSHDDVLHELSVASVFCLPSTDEGVPIAMLEAMAYGLACVVTAVGGIPEVVRDGENGIVVDVRDTDSLAHGLRRVLEDRDFAVKLGREARRGVESRYAISIVAREWDGIYTRLAEGSFEPRGA